MSESQNIGGDFSLVDSCTFYFSFRAGLAIERIGGRENLALDGISGVEPSFSSEIGVMGGPETALRYPGFEFINFHP